MISKKKYEEVKTKVLDLYDKAHIALTTQERSEIEISDMGLNKIDLFGLQLVIYVNTPRVCAKEMALLSHQTCPEHKHPYINATNPGKEETFRCRYGTVYLFVEGEPTKDIQAIVPKEGVFTVFHQIVLTPGEQYTITPNTLHWFKAGPDGAVVSEFSTHSNDATDIFTDKQVLRTPTIET